MRVRTRIVIERAIEEGIGYGLQRAYKHTDNPNREALAEAISMAIANALDEVLDYDVVPGPHEDEL